MTFLFILTLATLAAAGGSRLRSGAVRWRQAARHGLGIAFVAAGVSHLVDATPFEQHLPGWVPAATTIIVVSGIAEIVLGLALMAARRATAAVGLAAVVFLAGVFPANVYVAVADVDVDGLPGGIYPWLRLPLQGVFVVWAWASTHPSDPGSEVVPSERFGLMATVPPKHGPDRDETGARGRA